MALSCLGIVAVLASGQGKVLTDSSIFANLSMTTEQVAELSFAE